MTGAFFTRRDVLLGAAALSFARPLEVVAQGDDASWSHALSLFGDFKYPASFKNFDYVRPDAPKGGEIALQVSSLMGNQSFSTFDTLNIFSPKGHGAAGMELTFDSLMARSEDEPDSMYGLIAEAAQLDRDGALCRFRLRKEARFHSGAPITSADVVFSILTLKTQSILNYRMLLADVASVEASADDVVEVSFSRRNRQLPLIIAGLPIFSAQDYAERDFSETTLTPPLGSGPYRVFRADPGKTIIFERVPDYWGAARNVNVGRFNFDKVRYEYFRDMEASFQAFTRGVLTYREELRSVFWAKRYNDWPAFKEGRSKREEIPTKAPVGAQGWFFNTRRAKFKDPRIRAAIASVFDFEWVNQNLMFNLYERDASYFPNTPFAAQGLPSEQELGILEPFRNRLPKEAFEEAFIPPKHDGSGFDRRRLGQAAARLKAAGCVMKNDVLHTPDGKPLRITFMETANVFVKILSSFVKNLRLLGIDASVRLIDGIQMQHRLKTFDFDLASRRFILPEGLAAPLRAMFHSEMAEKNGALNLAGVANPVVDALIARVSQSRKREEARLAMRVLDRVLRSGFYWVPCWFTPTRRIAYWDVFGLPPESSSLYSFNPISLWWFDSLKAQP